MSPAPRVKADLALGVVAATATLSAEKKVCAEKHGLLPAPFAYG